MTHHEIATAASIWTEHLLRDDRQEMRPIRANLANVLIALRECPALAGKIGFDAFTGRICRTGPLPWRPDPGTWELIDDLRLTEFLQLAGINVSFEIVHQAVTAGSRLCEFHSVRDYLSGLQWDGVERLTACERFKD